MTRWNIGRIYKDQGDLTRAEQYMARTVEIMNEIGHLEVGRFRKELAELQAEIKGR